MPYAVHPGEAAIIVGLRRGHYFNPRVSSDVLDCLAGVSLELVRVEAQAAARSG
jgi:hypothetical protein